MDVRILVPGDETAIETFLATRRATSMFLRSNLRAAGLADDGRPLSGTYAGGFVDGALVAVASHVQNGIVLVQAATGAGEVARAACAASGRPVAGLSGPADQVRAARTALGLDDAPAAHAADERLYALALADLQVPPALARGELRWRVAEPRWHELLTAWRVAYVAEALGATIDDRARAAASSAIARSIADGSGFVVVAAAEPERPLAFACHNATLPDIVQIGGVWTPPEQRSAGLGRAVTAGALLAARDRGATDAVLFTDVPAAARAYEALGFRAIGSYGLMLL